jgi:hypothetical protein
MKIFYVLIVALGDFLLSTPRACKARSGLFCPNFSRFQSLQMFVAGRKKEIPYNILKGLKRSIGKASG